MESGVRILFTDGTIIGTKVMMMVRSTSQKSGKMMERTRTENVRRSANDDDGGFTTTVDSQTATQSEKEEPPLY